MVNRKHFNEDLVYVKGDGSVESGFEVVTHPCSLEFHRYFFGWHDLCMKATSLGYRSHNNESCGLHVHINRKFFGETQQEQNDKIAGIVIFVENNWSDIVKFSRRHKERLERWAKNYKQNLPKKAAERMDKIKDAKAKEIFYEIAVDNAHQQGDRYKAVNLMNRNTVEFRFFRGTLRTNSIIASLEFFQLLAEAAKNSSAYTMDRIGFKTIRRLAQKNNYTELLTYMDERDMYKDITPYKPYMKTIKDLAKAEKEDTKDEVEVNDTKEA